MNYTLKKVTSNKYYLIDKHGKRTSITSHMWQNVLKLRVSPYYVFISRFSSGTNHKFYSHAFDINGIFKSLNDINDFWHKVAPQMYLTDADNVIRRELIQDLRYVPDYTIDNLAFDLFNQANTKQVTNYLLHINIDSTGIINLASNTPIKGNLRKNVLSILTKTINK